MFDGRGMNVHTNTDVIELHQKRAFQHNIDSTRSRGDEWSLRAFASMPCTAIFLRANRAKVKFCEQLKIFMDHSSPLEVNIRTKFSQKFIYNITYANLLWLTHFMVKHPVKMFK